MEGPADCGPIAGIFLSPHRYYRQTRLQLLNELGAPENSKVLPVVGAFCDLKEVYLAHMVLWTGFERVRRAEAVGATPTCFQAPHSVAPAGVVRVVSEAAFPVHRGSGQQRAWLRQFGSQSAPTRRNRALGSRARLSRGAAPFRPCRAFWSVESRGRRRATRTSRAWPGPSRLRRPK